MMEKMERGVVVGFLECVCVCVVWRPVFVFCLSCIRTVYILRLWRVGKGGAGQEERRRGERKERSARSFFLFSARLVEVEVCEFCLSPLSLTPFPAPPPALSGVAAGKEPGGPGPGARGRGRL